MTELRWLDYPMRPVTSCPACGSTRIRPAAAWAIRHCNGLKMPGSICKECGSKFQNPAMTPGAATRFYRDGDYRRTTHLTSEVCDLVLAEQQKSAEGILGWLPDIAPKYTVDIGCGSGRLLATLRNRYGCRVLGVEIDTKYRQYATDSGIPCVTLIEEVDGQPDFVAIIHTLEHMVEPLVLLKRVREWNPILLVEVPLLVKREAHPVAFSPKGILRALELSGFRPIKGDVSRSCRILAGSV